MSETKLSRIYYSPKGYWKGLGAIQKLAEAGRVSNKVARDWLQKQALWRVHLSAPRYIPRPKFDVPTQSKVHQADFLFWPHDTLGRGRGRPRKLQRLPAPFNVFQSRAAAVARAFASRSGSLVYGCCFQNYAWSHRDQAIVERFNRTLAERLFGHQYAVEIKLPEGQRSTEWVVWLPAVVSALNNEVTTFIGKKPSKAIKEKPFVSKPSTPYFRSVGLKEEKLSSLVNVRYLYQPGELEGGRRRASDPIWSSKVFDIERAVTKPNEPVMYYLRGGPKRGFVREKLLVAPYDTELPSSTVVL